MVQPAIARKSPQTEALVDVDVTATGLPQIQRLDPEQRAQCVAEIGVERIPASRSGVGKELWINHATDALAENDRNVVMPKFGLGASVVEGKQSVKLAGES